MTLSVRHHYHHDRRRPTGRHRRSQLCGGGDGDLVDTAFYRPGIEKPPGSTTHVASWVGRSGPPGRPSSAPAARRARLAPRHTRSNGRSDPPNPSPTIAATYLSSIFRPKSPLRLAAVRPVGSIMRRPTGSGGDRPPRTPSAEHPTRPHTSPIHIAVRTAPGRRAFSALYKTNIAWFICCPRYGARATSDRVPVRIS